MSSAGSCYSWARTSIIVRRCQCSPFSWFFHVCGTLTGVFFLATLDANAFDVPFGWMIVVKNYRIQTCLLLLPCFWELTGFADWDGWHTSQFVRISRTISWTIPHLCLNFWRPILVHLKWHPFNVQVPGAEKYFIRALERYLRSPLRLEPEPFCFIQELTWIWMGKNTKKRFSLLRLGWSLDFCTANFKIRVVSWTDSEIWIHVSIVSCIQASVSSLSFSTSQLGRHMSPEWVAGRLVQDVFNQLGMLWCNRGGHKVDLRVSIRYRWGSIGQWCVVNPRVKCSKRC